MRFGSTWLGPRLALTLLPLISNLVASSVTVGAQVFVIAADEATAETATDTLNGYGIPFETLLVPIQGAVLPSLNTTDGNGIFGLIVVMAQVSYYYGDKTGWHSALTTTQWNTIYNYQTLYGVRMVHMNAYPGSQFGTSPLGGCCSADVQQTVTLDSNIASSDFPTAGLKSPALNMTGIWHYPSTVTDTSTTRSFLTFSANSQFTTTSSGGVINKFSDGREQMVFHMSFGTWSPVSSYMCHIWIHWGMRGLYGGYRRVYLNTQIDDLFLPSAIYKSNNTFRLRPVDVQNHATWQDSINTNLVKNGNTGSAYFAEFGFNGNGNFLFEQTMGNSGDGEPCAEPINYVANEVATPLEFQKVLGTGTNQWPAGVTYNWTMSCSNLDPLVALFITPAVRDKFALVSHTFTHLGENPITYSDAFNEISYNIDFAKITGLNSARMYSPHGLIPPAITGLYNGDAIKAWVANNLTSCVGDNTRTPLRNAQNDMWPLITTSAANGYDGFTVCPRWATRIYYNCDTSDCTVKEWQDTSAGVGDIYALLALEQETTSQHLLGLYHDPYMFHQANLRVYDVDLLTINGKYQRWSLLQMWVESVLADFTQYTNWPILSAKHDDMAKNFVARMTRDACNPMVSYILSDDKLHISGVSVTTTGNVCVAPIPVTFPGTVTNVGSYTTEQIGNDPLTVWVTMAGSPMNFTLGTPIPIFANGGAGTGGSVGYSGPIVSGGGLVNSVADNSNSATNIGTSVTSTSSVIVTPTSAAGSMGLGIVSSASAVWFVAPTSAAIPATALASATAGSSPEKRDLKHGKHKARHNIHSHAGGVYA